MTQLHIICSADENGLCWADGTQIRLEDLHSQYQKQFGKDSVSSICGGFFLITLDSDQSLPAVLHTDL